MRFFVLVGVFLGLCAFSVDAQEASKPNGRVRVALVGSLAGESISSLLDLAHAKISMQPGVELLDREAMTRILQEQKLSLSGLVDANTAVVAGKLLRVDLFVFVEADPISKDALGLIIYDAATGVKLHDAALPPGKLDEQIAAVSNGVRHAADKEAAGLKGLRTVCVLSVRNADLPRAQDELGQTIAFLLERQLLGSPKLAVLERKRLDFVTKEKMLPTETRHKELLASVVMIDVEISRAGAGKTIRATAFLTDNQGKQLGKVHVEEADPKAGSLAEKLQAALWKYWQADPPAKTPDASRESKRFHQEGKRLYSQKEWRAATQALDAAYALDPAQPLLQVNLVKYLGDQGFYLVRPGAPVIANGKLQVPVDKLKDALHLSLRALDLRRQALRELPTTDYGLLHSYSVQYRGAPNMLVIRDMQSIDPQRIDAEAAQLRQQWHEQYRLLLKEEFERWAAVAREELRAPRPSSNALASFTKALQDSSHDLAGVLEKSEIELLLLPFYQPWLDLSILPKATISNYRLSLFCRYYVPLRPEYAGFYDGLAKHPHPLAQLHGRWFRLQMDMKNQKVSPGQAQLDYQEIRAAAFKSLVDFQPEANVLAQDDLRTGLYDFLFTALEQWPYPNPDQRFQERFALVDFMLDRQELVGGIVQTVAQHDSKSKTSWHSQRWEVIERALKLMETGKPQLSDAASFRIFHLRDQQKKILAERPEFAEKLAPAAPLWSQAERLLNTEKHRTIRQTGRPLIDGDDVYIVGSGPEDGAYWLQLMRISLKDKTTTMLGKARLRPVPAIKNLSPNVISVCCLGKDRIFVGTHADGLYAFDRTGNPGQLLAKDLPSQEIEALTYHDGKLHVALRGGYLVTLDPETGKFETLASSRRRERLSPFDDSEVFRIPYLVADAQRHRLIFLLHQKPNRLIYYPSSLIPPEETTNGLWEYDFKTKAFKRHYELYYGAFTWGSSIRAGHVLLAKTAYHQTGVMDFDLATNKGRLLWAGNPIGPELPKEKALIQADYFPFSNVQLLRGNWLWCAHPFNRASLSERRQESLPALGETSLYQSFSAVALEPIGTDQLLLANPSGLWLLQLSKAN